MVGEVLHNRLKCDCKTLVCKSIEKLQQTLNKAVAPVMYCIVYNIILPYTKLILPTMA